MTYWWAIDAYDTNTPAGTYGTGASFEESAAFLPFGTGTVSTPMVYRQHYVEVKYLDPADGETVKTSYSTPIYLSLAYWAYDTDVSGLAYAAYEKFRSKGWVSTEDGDIAPGAVLSMTLKYSDTEYDVTPVTP